MTQLPLIALYNYDNTILDGLTALTAAELDPNLEYVSSIPVLTNDEFRALLLAEVGELTIFYGEPALFKAMLETWAKTQRPNWVKLWQTTLLKYNPIWNKDGTVTETNSSWGGSNSSGGVTYGRTDTHNVTGYDTNSFSPDDQTILGGSDSNSGHTDYQNGESRSRTERGNIGVTTTQEMLRQERNAAVFNVYDYIIEAFKKRFCIMLY